jgi:tetratricopeptide (TPR) repeat protein
VFGASSVYIAQRNWTRAVEILEQALSINPEQQNVRVRLLELYCYANNLDAARSQFEYLQSSPNPPHSYYQAAAKFFSETHQWNLAFEFASQAVIVEPKNKHNHRLFLKVVRKTRRYLEALEVLERVINKAETQDAQLLLLKSSILEHLLYPIQEAKKCITELKTLNQPVLDINIIEKRLQIKESLFSQVVAPSKILKTRFFYCTDLAYSLPTLVSIYSLWKYNQTKLGKSPISVIADQSTLDFIEGAYTTLADQLNFNLNLINIESLVQGLEHQKLATQYGVFSGGDSLVPTAYYRLFLLSI